MSMVGRCLGCSATYPADDHACSGCGSHAAEVEQAEETEDAAAAVAKPKPARRRKT